MNLNQFMNANLAIIKDDIIKNLPTEFDSHDFIRSFARMFEVDYVNFLKSHDEQPFRKVHALIGTFLSSNKETLTIESTGKKSTPNIFGVNSDNEGWIKIA